MQIMESMEWYEAAIITTSEASDVLSDALTSMGAAGVAIEDPDDIRREVARIGSLDYIDDGFLSALGEDVVIKAYFPGDTNMEELMTAIKGKINFISQHLDTGKGCCSYTGIKDEDWADSWKKYYKPFSITEKIIIKPSWEAYEQRSDEIVIELDPGMAFGTGTHETTQMCARMLEKYIKTGDTVLDVGCGTGILSIIAVKLGAASVTALDTDEIAVRVAKENSKINNTDNHIHILKGVLSDLGRIKSDIITANIIADVIINISGSIPHYLKVGGFLITSGIIKGRKQDVIDAYIKLGFVCETTIESGEWVAIVFKCLNSL